MEKQRSFKRSSQSPKQNNSRGNSCAWTRCRNGGDSSIPSRLDPALPSALTRLVALNWLVIIWGLFNIFVQIKQKKKKIAVRAGWYLTASRRQQRCVRVRNTCQTRETEAEHQDGASRARTRRNTHFSPSHQASSFVLGSAETFP